MNFVENLFSNWSWGLLFSCHFESHPVCQDKFLIHWSMHTHRDTLNPTTRQMYMQTGYYKVISSQLFIVIFIFIFDPGQIIVFPFPSAHTSFCWDFNDVTLVDENINPVSLLWWSRCWFWHTCIQCLGPLCIWQCWHKIALRSSFWFLKDSCQS